MNISFYVKHFIYYDAFQYDKEIPDFITHLLTMEI